jgi:hypothetical protein
MPARIPVGQLVVPRFLAQQRQTLFYIRPAVRVTFGFCRQRARVQRGVVLVLDFFRAIGVFM